MIICKTWGTLLNHYKAYNVGKIIAYSWNTISAYSLILHEWWIPLIKFMMGPTILVREGIMHLWYSGST